MEHEPRDLVLFRWGAATSDHLALTGIEPPDSAEVRARLTCNRSAYEGEEVQDSNHPERVHASYGWACLGPLRYQLENPSLERIDGQLKCDLRPRRE